MGMEIPGTHEIHVYVRGCGVLTIGKDFQNFGPNTDR